MSCDVCRKCKNVGYCTFPRNGVITQCEEYEDFDQVAAFDWNLQDMLKSWNRSRAGRGLPESVN